MKGICIIVITFLQLLGFFCQAQAPFISKLTNKPSYNHYDIISLDDSNFITLEASDKNEDLSFRLTRFNKYHNIKWAKLIEIPGNNEHLEFYDFARVNENTFYLTTINDQANKKYWQVTKLTGQGKILWNKKIKLKLSNFNNLFLYQRAEMLDNIEGTVTEDNGYVFTFGYFRQFLQDTSYLSIAKLNANGNLAWLRTYTDFKRVTLSDGISYQSNGNVNQEKYTFSIGNGMLTFDNQGFLVNYKTYYKNQSPVKRNFNILKVSQNNYIYCTDIEDFEVTLTKLDSNLIPVWGRNYDFSKGVSIKGLEIAKDGNPVFIYNKILEDDGEWVTNTIINLMKVNNKGVPIIARTFQNLYHQGSYANNLHSTRDSGFIFMLQDTLWNNTILKADQNLNTPCKQDSIQVKVDSFNVVDQQLPFPILTDSIDYRFSDTSISITDATNKETIICSEYPIPKVRLKDTILCRGQSHTLAIEKDSSHFDLQWSTGDTTNSITIDSSGTYWAGSSYDTITVTDTAHITFLEDIKTGLPDDTSFCPYDSVKLTIQHPANANFTWVTPEKDSTGNNIEEHDKAIWAQDTGSYYLKVQEANHCKPVDTIHLHHHPLPSADAGPDTTLCYNQTYTMQGQGGITYQWIPAHYLSNDSIAQPKAELPNQQRYKLIVGNQHGCKDTSDVFINVRDSLKVDLSTKDTFVCKSTQVELTANPNGGYSPNYQFNWPSDTTSTPSSEVTPVQSGWHRVTLKDYCSQPAKDSIYIEVAQPPVADFKTSPQDTAYTKQEVRFFNQSTNAVRYNWSFGKPGLNSSNKNPMHGYQDSGTYPVKLQAYGQADCGTDAKLDTLHVIDTTSQFKVYIPDAFSPNHDGTNDEWKIKGVGIEAIQFDIYNRWGQQVFSANNQRSWDGQFRKSDEKVQEGVYLYLLKVTDTSGNPHYYSGEIHVIK